MSHLESIEPWTPPTIVWQGPTYQHAPWSTRSVCGQNERLQVPHNTPISWGNLNVEIITYSYCQHVGHRFKHCPFVDDTWIELLRYEVMNIHQLVVPITTIILPNVIVQGIQVMNSSFGHMAILVNYQPTNQPPITPFVLSKINLLHTFTYPMWCTVIPP